MALREYKCDCGYNCDMLYQKEYPKTIICENCGGTAKHTFGGFSHTMTFRYGWDPGAGKGFDSKRQRDNHLAANNLEPAPDGAYEAAYKG